MPIIRNPFRKQDEHLRPGNLETGEKQDHSGTKPIDIKEPTEYKLCEIDDSGVYLPPSPPERKNFWSSRSTGSTNSSNHRSFLSDEPFNISRESFDSYRRSFDISARAPVAPAAMPQRQSFDSRVQYQFRSSSSFNRPEPTAEEDFEDVGLQDEPKPKKRGFLSRLTDSNENHTGTDGRPTSSHHHGFHFTGRKRGQSGQGAELGSWPNANAPESKKGGND